MATRTSSLAPIPAPQKQSAPEHPGDRLANYFDNFFKTLLAIATVGANITFSKIVQAPVTPTVNYGITKVGVLYYLGFSFFFFVLTVAFTALFTSLLSLYKPYAVQYFGTRVTRQRRIVMWYATGVSSLLYGFLLAAFVFISLVVVAYVGPVGWAAIAFVTLFGVIGFGAIISQSPIFMGPDGKQDFPQLTGQPGSRRQRPDRHRRPSHGEVIYYDEKHGMVVDGGYDDDVFERRRPPPRGRRTQYDEEAALQAPVGRSRSGRHTELIGGEPVATDDGTRQQTRMDPSGGYDEGIDDRRQQGRAEPTAGYDGGQQGRVDPTGVFDTGDVGQQRLSRQDTVPAYDPNWRYSRDGQKRVDEYNYRTSRQSRPPQY